MNYFCLCWPIYFKNKSMNKFEERFEQKKNRINKLKGNWRVRLTTSTRLKRNLLYRWTYEISSKLNVTTINSTADVLFSEIMELKYQKKKKRNDDDVIPILKTWYEKIKVTGDFWLRVYRLSTSSREWVYRREYREKGAVNNCEI